MKEAEISSLLNASIRRFDELQDSGDLFYGDTEAENVDGEFPVNAECSMQIIPRTDAAQLRFSLVRAFERKPWPNHEDVKPAAKPDPFGHPEPAFVITEITGYVLQLNKFCAVRPQLLLHPKTFKSQKDRLERADFEALVGVLEQLGENVLAFYNCGKDAGSSQPYKHIQIIPKPDPEDFVLWPERPPMIDRLRWSAKHEVLEPAEDLHVPYICRLAFIEHSAAGAVHEIYQKLLSTLETVLGEQVGAHNVVITRSWLCVIPRRASGADGHPGANSMGIMGIIWVASQGERDAWDELGMVKYLKSMTYV